MKQKKLLTRYQMCQKVAKGCDDDEADYLNIPGSTKLGSGCSRTAFAHPKYPKVVFKVGCSWDNRAEMRFWKKSPPLVRKFLARCITISKNGTVLCQERIYADAKFNEDSWTWEWKDKDIPKSLREYGDRGVHNGCIDKRGQLKIWDYPIG